MTWKALAQVALGAVVMTVFSQVAIPLQPVPITLQTVAIMGLGLFLPPFQAALSMFLWVVLGAVGMPVFAEGSCGLAKLFGPTGGYILGFLVAAPLLSFLYRRCPISPMRLFGLFALTNVVIMLCGWMVLGVSLHDYGLAFSLGVSPFLLGAGIKILLTMGTYPLWKRHSVV